MAIVVPAPGTLKDTARLLLSLADHVHDVRTVSNGTQFEVPDELADRYHQALSGAVPDGPSKPAPKRRGRTPRVTSEE